MATNGLKRDSTIEFHWASQRPRIVLDGNEIARSRQVLCPLGDVRIVFYSLEAATLRAAIPAGWNAEEMGAVLITLGKPSSADFKVSASDVDLQVPAQ